MLSQQPVKSIDEIESGKRTVGITVPPTAPVTLTAALTGWTSWRHQRRRVGLRVLVKLTTSEDKNAKSLEEIVYNTSVRQYLIFQPGARYYPLFLVVTDFHKVGLAENEDLISKRGDGNEASKLVTHWVLVFQLAILQYLCQ